MGDDAARSVTATREEISPSRKSTTGAGGKRFKPRRGGVLFGKSIVDSSSSRLKVQTREGDGEVMVKLRAKRSVTATKGELTLTKWLTFAREKRRSRCASHSVECRVGVVMKGWPALSRRRWTRQQMCLTEVLTGFAARAFARAVHSDCAMCRCAGSDCAISSAASFGLTDYTHVDMLGVR